MGLWWEDFPISFNPIWGFQLLRRVLSGERLFIVYSPDDEADIDGYSFDSPGSAAHF